LDEHGFLIYQLLWQDPQHRSWYVGARQQSPGYWVNDGDGSSMNDMEAAFFPENENEGRGSKDYLVYRYDYF
jgi:hypothetical protein